MRAEKTKTGNTAKLNKAWIQTVAPLQKTQPSLPAILEEQTKLLPGKRHRTWFFPVNSKIFLIYAKLKPVFCELNMQDCPSQRNQIKIFMQHGIFQWNFSEVPANFFHKFSSEPWKTFRPRFRINIQFLLLHFFVFHKYSIVTSKNVMFSIHLCFGFFQTSLY